MLCLLVELFAYTEDLQRGLLVRSKVVESRLFYLSLVQVGRVEYFPHHDEVFIYLNSELRG
jgi:hypothetical protein